MIDRELLETIATAIMERRIKPDMPALLGKHWTVDHDMELARAAITAYLTALAALEKSPTPPDLLDTGREG